MMLQDNVAACLDGDGMVNDAFTTHLLTKA